MFSQIEQLHMSGGKFTQNNYIHDNILKTESLKKLKESEAASYNALSAQLVQRRGCTPNTRQRILDDLMKWAKDPHSSRLYWMNGMAGTGKTTIAYSFCEQLHEKGLLGANFFCSRSLAECNDIRYIIPTIACQLARSCPQFGSALLKILDSDFQLPSLSDQLKRLLCEPFQSISSSVTDTLIVVIDALDECSNRSLDTRLFLERICNYFSSNTFPLKAFVTSRPEDVISRNIAPLKPPSPSEWSVVHIHDIEESLVQTDIKVFVEDELAEIAKTWGLEDGWPPSTEVDVVVGNANRLFIYAATMIRYVGVDSGNPRRRLSQLASTSRIGNRMSQSSSLGTQLIDELYMTILARAFHEKDGEENLVARMVLKLIVCVQTPLTLTGIVDLLNGSEELEIEILASDIRTALKLLPSVISTPMDDSGVVTTFHASFPDFLFDICRCGPNNHIPFLQSHQDLARMCLHFMDRSLTVDDISGSGRWQTVDAILKQKKIESWISSALAYSCMFWGSHIDSNDEIGIESLSTELDHFLTHSVLRWLEVLSLLRRLDIGVEVLQKMRECKYPTLASRFDDAYKFLKDIFSIINVWPCEVFHSGLVWAPEQSFVRKTYLKTPRVWIVRGQRAGWGACEHTIQGHSGEVYSVAASPDNRHVVSGSSDRTVRIWNALTGEEELVLRGHSSHVRSVSVSPDNHHIVSGSSDRTVRIWNISTGEEEHVLRGHFRGVNSVTVSPDNYRIISGSSDNTVRIWNMSTGEEEHVLRGHFGEVYSVTVSPDNCHVVSGSTDNTVRVWNALTGEEEYVLRGHSTTVRSVAVSPDNCHVVSGSTDDTIRIWNTSTGEEEYVLRGHSNTVRSVAVSPDNRHIVSGSEGRSIRIWNALTGAEEHVLRGHFRGVNSVTVSPDNYRIISGSSDNTVRIWNAFTGPENVPRGHSRDVTSVAVFPNNQHLVSGSYDTTVRIWDTSTGKEVHVLRGHSNIVTSVAVSADNRHVLSGSYDNTIRIWDPSTGAEEHVFRGHSNTACSLAVSPDNCHILGGLYDDTVRIWNAWTGAEEHVLRGHSALVRSVAVSPDNRHVVSGSYDNTVRIWNALTGEKVLPSISFVISSGNCHVMSGPPPVKETIQISKAFLSSMVTSVAFLAQGAKIMSIPIIQRLVSGERLDLEIFLQAIWNGLSPVPITLAPDGLSILLSNGQRCLAIPSTLQDISCAAFSGSKVYLGHGSGQITILQISN